MFNHKNFINNNNKNFMAAIHSQKSIAQIKVQYFHQLN